MPQGYTYKVIQNVELLRCPSDNTLPAVMDSEDTSNSSYGYDENMPYLTPTINKVTRPSYLMINLDAHGWYMNCGSYWGSQMNYVNCNATSTLPYFRHNGARTLNGLLADGHVQSFKEIPGGITFTQTEY